MRPLGIHVRLLLAGFLLISATTLTMGYVGTKIIHQFVQSRFEERIHFLARYLALNAELGILIDQRQMLTQLARNLLSEQDVVRVAICDENNHTLADESRFADGITKVIVNPVVMKESTEDGLSWNFFPGTKEQLIGYVRITYTTEGLQQLMTTMKVRFVWLAMALALLSIFIFYFISRSIVAPVGDLAKAARQVARGDLGLRVKPSTLPETRELAEAFNAMLESLEKSEKALMEANRKMIRQKTLAEVGKFSMVIAHEVKNPLGIIKSSVDILKKDLPDPDNHIMVEYIEDEISRLNRLIEDFLLFAKPAKLRFRSLDINATLEECVIRFEQSINALEDGDQPVAIQTQIPEVPFYLNGDPDMLIRAFGNMLKNAYESEGNAKQIQVIASQDGQWWTLDISDNGSGIDPDVIGRIFEPFFTTRSRGTGLGLAFVYQVVRAHGGQVTAWNRPEGGAIFRVELPVQDAVAEPVAGDNRDNGSGDLT